MTETDYAISSRGKEYVKANYPLIYDAVERFDNGLCVLRQIADQFYYNMAKYDNSKSNPVTNPILIGKFINEMAKAVCYVSEEAIDYDYDNYFVLLFSELDSVNVVTNCFIHAFDRMYSAFNIARQPVGIFPGREYIYRHAYSVENMLRFIEKVREVYNITPIKMNISNPVKEAITDKETLKALKDKGILNPFEKFLMPINWEENDDGDEQEASQT